MNTFTPMTAPSSTTRTGHRPAHRLQPRLAAQLRRLRGPDALPRLHGYRCIAHDDAPRPLQPAMARNDMDTFADDLAQLVHALDLQHAVHVGHSMGGARWPVTSAATAPPRRQGRPHRRCAAAHAPDRSQPGGLPIEVFDQIRASILADRSSSSRMSARPSTAQTSPAVKSPRPARQLLAPGMTASLKAVFDCVKAFSETDFTQDLKNSTSPPHPARRRRPDGPHCSLRAHHRQTHPGATLKIYPGASHGLCSTHKNQINTDLLEFIQQ